MKRLHLEKILLWIVLVIGATVTLSAQETDDGCITSVREMIRYNIQISDIPSVDHSKVFLEGYSCSGNIYVDSAEVKKGKAKFKSKAPVSPGVYRLVFEHGQAPMADIMLQDASPLKMKLSTDNAAADSKDGNYFCKPGSHAFNYANLYDAIRKNPQTCSSVDALRQLVKSHVSSPGNFIEQYYLYDVVFAAMLENVQSDNQMVISKTVFEYLLDKLDIASPMTWNSQYSFHPFLVKYLTDNQIFDVDYLTMTIDEILIRCNSHNVTHQVAAFLFNAYSVTGEPTYEPIMLHLYDDYDLPCWLGDRARLAKRKMECVRRLMPGALIPELTAYDIDSKEHSTNDIQTKYTILWFWDPDCDHCQEMTPELHELYQDRADELGFEVFAVEVNDDYERWKAFSEKYQLDDWINLSTSMGEASVDFIEYFDIMTTPVILLIDNEKNHAIIARQITLDEIVKAMSR